MIQKLVLKFSKEPFLFCKDHTVSGQTFELRRDDNFDLLATFPKPSEEELPSYYISEKYISHTDSRKTVFDWLYQRVKSFMLEKKLNWINKEVGERVHILDVGAGTGDFLLAASQRGWKVSGVEPNTRARKIAAKKGIFLKETTSGLEEASFDVITLWHVLEHIPDLEQQISELRRLLKNDGLLVVAVPNFRSYDAQFYGEHWAGYDVPRHLYHFSRRAINYIFSRNNFENLYQKGLPFDAYYVSILSESYKRGRKNWITAFWIGFFSNWKARATGEYSSIVYFLKRR